MNASTLLIAFPVAGLTALLLHSHADADTLRVPQDYATIQAAIDAAVDGDTVVLDDGVYSGAGNVNIDFGGREIHLVSLNGPDACVIDGGYSSRLMRFRSGESPDAVVDRITFRYAWSDEGGAAIEIDESSPTIRSCRFEWCESLFDGGAVALSQSDARFIDCEFDTNASYLGVGGAIAVQGNGSPDWERCRFAWNTAQSGGAVYATSTANTALNFNECEFEYNAASLLESGGAIASREASLSLQQCRFVFNESGDGGAISMRAGSIEAIDCTLLDNRSEFTGGAISDYFGASELVLRSSDFAFNTAQSGGAIHAEGQLAIADCEFDSNEAETAGGVLTTGVAVIERSNFTANHHAGLWVAGTNSTAVVENSRFIANVNPFGSGGGARISGEAVFAGCLFARNESASGGALAVTGGDLEIINCTLAQNAAGARGGAVNAASASRVSISNSIAWFNTALHGPQLAFSNAINVSVTCSNIEGGESGVASEINTPSWNEGNVEADPLFNDPDTNDYRLRSGSMCIDAGSNSFVPSQLHDDLAGIDRYRQDTGVLDRGFGTAPIVDMGAFERAQSSVFSFAAYPTPITSGTSVWLVVGNADPETRTGLVYSLTGPGTTPIEWLNVSLDIAAPLLIREKRTNENGWLVVRIDTADGVASPRPIWFQAIQSGQVSNVIGTRIIP